MEWHELECSVRTAGGTAVGLRIARFGALGGHELIVLMRQSGATERAPQQAHSERIPIDEYLEVKLNGLSSLHIARQTPNKFSLTLHGSPQTRGSAGLGFVALEGFATFLEHLKSGDDMVTRTAAPTYEFIRKAHEDATRLASRPATGRSMPKLPSSIGGHKARSSLGGASVGSCSSPRKYIEEIPASSFYSARRGASDLWGLKAGTGTRQMLATQALTSAQAPVALGAGSKLIGPPARDGSGRLAAALPSSSSQYGVRDRALQGTSPPAAGGAVFGYIDDESARPAVARRPESTLFSALVPLIHKRQTAGGDAQPDTPRRLKDAIARRSAQFAGFAQQDAHEFLADFLDGLHEEMSEALGAARDAALLSAARKEGAQADMEEEITPPLQPAQMGAAAAAQAQAQAQAQAGRNSSSPALATAPTDPGAATASAIAAATAALPIEAPTA